jgi:hypothetical protein
MFSEGVNRFLSLRRHAANIGMIDAITTRIKQMTLRKKYENQKRLGN